jgi:hypothetical protein
MACSILITILLSLSPVLFFIKLFEKKTTLFSFNPGSNARPLRVILSVLTALSRKKIMTGSRKSIRNQMS